MAMCHAVSRMVHLHRPTRREALIGSLLPPIAARGERHNRGAVLVIKDVTVIDGTGSTKRDQTVVVEGSRIAAITPSTKAQPWREARVIDSRGRFLIPGLWDMHVHLSYTKGSALGLLLANGVTAIRDCGGLLREIDEWRVQIQDASRPGPRIYRCGPVLNSRGEFQQFAVADAAEARGAVKGLQRAGVDFIKVHAAISRDAYSGVASECKKLALPFCGHIPRAVTAEEATEAGQSSIEHIDTLFDSKFPEDAPSEEIVAGMKRFAVERAPALFESFRKNGTWVTPTLSVSMFPYMTALAQSIRGETARTDLDRYVSRSSRKLTGEIIAKYRDLITPSFVKRHEASFREYLTLTKLMQQSDVGLLAGTDFATSVTYPGFGLHDELALLVKSGLTPMQALQTATRNPARFMKSEDLGTVEVGKTAHLVLLDSDPLQDIRNTRSISTVVLNGNVFDKRALKTILGEAERQAREV
jgi:predicted amidohydrolase